jgi:hypothetical protein
VVKALVTGGYYDAGGDGVVWLVDLATERAEVVLRWEPPPHLHVPTKGFAGGSLAANGDLFIAAHAAIVRVDARAARVSGVLHQPCMNDLHHVAIDGNRLLVSNTGLGAVDVLGVDGAFLGSHALLPAWINARRIGGADPAEWSEVLELSWEGAEPVPWPVAADVDGYYSAHRRAAPFHQLKVRDHLHLNHVAVAGDRILATCFADGSLRDVGRLEVVWQRAGAYLHDGVVDGDSFWLTAIDGTLLELDSATLDERRELAVFDTGHHGWCRGLAISREHLLVGLTQVRRERLPRHRWANRGPDGSETSVLLLDRGGRLQSRVDLTDATRHSKLYSIIPLEGAAA